MSLLENLLSHGAIVRLGWMLVHFLWQAGAVAILLAILLRLLRRASANLRYLVACGALALTVAMPLVTMQFIDIPGPVAETGPLSETLTPTVTPTPMTVQLIEELPPLSSVPPLEEADLTTPIPWHERLATVLEPALPYLVLGWLAGVFGLSAWHLGGWAQLQRLRRRMVRDAGGALHTTLDELATRLGVRRAVTLLESALVEVPTVVGWLHPAILLPASALTGLNPDQLRAILAHELAHIHRYDYLANIVQTVVEILGFYHPAVWWVSHHIRIERENCCDDMAVRVCDNSLQYARALASMEEIRHSRSDLAMAASGGSLMARVARLLGRPVVDDRCFTWLPGLIALLLVVGVVIPAALALTCDAPHLPGSQADVAPDSAAESQDAADSGESTPAQIQVTFVLAELYADTVLDPQTAEEVAGLVTRIPANDGKSIAPPSIEELQRPLADVLAAFTPAPGRAREFVDLLSRKEDCVARRLSAPQVTSLSGESLQFTMGDIPNPDEPLPQDSEFTFVRCAMTAAQVPDRNAIQMDIDMVRMYPADEPSDPNEQAATWAIKTTVIAPNNQWTTITDERLTRADRSGRECIQLPLILATILDEPEATGIDMRGAIPMMASADGAVHLPPGMGAFRPATPAAPTRILMSFDVFPEVSPDKPVDRETRSRIAEILASENAQIAGPDPQQNATLGEVLQIWIAGRPMAPRTMAILIDTLQSRGYLEGEGRLEAMANNHRQAQMTVGAEEISLPSTDPASPPKTVKLGTFMQATPHLSSLPNDPITLEIAAQWRERVGHDKPGSLPVIHTTEMVSTLTIPNDQCQALVAVNANDPDAGMRVLLVGPPTVIQPTISPDPIAAPQSGAPTPDEPARTQVLLAFTVLDVMTDRVLDPDTAVQARHCLTRIPPADGGTASASTAPLLVEELVLPLRDVFARFTPIPEKSKDFTDLLVSCGYATVLSKSMILTFTDEPAPLSWGEPNDPSATDGYMRLTATAHVLDDRNATRLEIDYLDRRARGDSNDPNPPISSTQIVSTLVVSNDQYAAIVGMNAGTPGNSIRMLLIGPTKVYRPQRAAGQNLNATEQAIVKTRGQNSTEHRNERQVLIDFVVAKALTESVPDRETLSRIGEILAAEKLQVAKELAGENKTTLGEVLRKYVASRSLSQETGQALIDLLQARGLVKIRLSPQVSAGDGQQFEVRNVSNEQFFLRSSQKTDATTQTQLQKVEYGTWIKGTPHVESDKSITVEMVVRTADPAPRAQPSDLPVVRTQAVESTMTVANNRYFSLLVEPDGKEAADANGPSSLLVLFKPTIDEASSGPPDTAFAQGKPAVSHPRQVLLNVRVVEMEPGKQRNLGMEWDFPASQAGQAPADSDWTKALSIGSALDQTSTNSLMAKLNQLEATRQAEIVSNPQIVTLDGRPARLQSIQEEWFLMTGTNTPGGDSHSELQRIESGTILDFTPHVGDSSEITLEVTVETSKSHPQEGDATDLPIVTRRQSRNKVTIQDGGTIALAGLIENPGGQSGPSARTVVVFATASVVSETGDISQPRPRVSQKRQMRVWQEARYRRVNHLTPQQVKDLLPSEYQEYVRVEEDAAASRLDRFLTVTATATTSDEIMQIIDKLDVPPRQVLLDVRVVEMEHGKLAKLAIEWDRRTGRAGGSDNGSWPKNIQIGRWPDPTFTDSLVKTLNQLESADRARQMANPQITVPNRRETQLRTIQGGWFMMNAPDPNSLVDGAKLEKLPCAAILSIVPRIGDSNEITLEMAISVSDSFPNGEAADLPLDGRPQNRNPVTIQDGGTVVLAGFPTKPARQHGPPTKEIAIFVTAYLIPQANEIPGSAASEQPAATKQAGTPITARFEGVDLREALRDLADNAGVPIVVDLNVHGKVSARIENLDLEKAMDIVLAGTPYTFKRMRSHYLVGDFYPIRVDYRRP